MKRYTKEINEKTVIKTRQQIVISKNGMNTYNPTEEMILADDWVEYVEPTPTEADIIRQRMVAIEMELRSMDYLTSKELDGEDMTKYNEQYVGGYKQHRRELRAEYNVLEEQLKELS